MTDNMKKFLEEASKDEAFMEKLRGAETKDIIIEMAKEKGFTLTEEDLKAPETNDGPVSDDEVDAVAGGTVCVCIVGGGGEGNDDLSAINRCWCVAMGHGEDEKKTGSLEVVRCFCMTYGGGKDDT